METIVITVIITASLISLVWLIKKLIQVKQEHNNLQKNLNDDEYFVTCTGEGEGRINLEPWKTDSISASFITKDYICINGEVGEMYVCKKCSFTSNNPDILKIHVSRCNHVHKESKCTCVVTFIPNF